MSDTSTRDRVLEIICSISVDALDNSINIRLKDLIGKSDAEIKDKLLGIIDDCAFASLATTVLITSLDHLWRSIGGTEEELVERNKQLDNLSSRKILKDRFCWQYVKFFDE